jgi:hypothetical protein
MEQTNGNSKKNATKVSKNGKDGEEHVVNEYINNCRQFDISIDPSVVIALKTK